MNIVISGGTIYKTVSINPMDVESATFLFLLLRKTVYLIDTSLVKVGIKTYKWKKFIMKDFFEIHQYIQSCLIRTHTQANVLVTTVVKDLPLISRQGLNFNNGQWDMQNRSRKVDLRPKIRIEWSQPLPYLTSKIGSSENKFETQIDSNWTKLDRKFSTKLLIFA